jgi:ankyrin repeat protein
LFYAINSPRITALHALLRRGADPNSVLYQENGRGNTPLHFACFFEKPKFVELLLEYKANPLAYNAAGQTPIELLPKDATPSVKMQLAKMIKVFI